MALWRHFFEHMPQINGVFSLSQYLVQLRVEERRF